MAHLGRVFAAGSLSTLVEARAPRGTSTSRRASRREFRRTAHHCSEPPMPCLSEAPSHARRSPGMKPKPQYLWVGFLDAHPFLRCAASPGVPRRAPREQSRNASMSLGHIGTEFAPSLTGRKRRAALDARRGRVLRDARRGNSMMEIARRGNSMMEIARRGNSMMEIEFHPAPRKATCRLRRRSRRRRRPCQAQATRQHTSSAAKASVDRIKMLA